MGSPVRVDAPPFPDLPFRVVSDRTDRLDVSAAQIEAALEAADTRTEGWEVAIAQLFEDMPWGDLEIQDDIKVEVRLARLALSLTPEQLAAINSRACWNLNKRLMDAVLNAFRVMYTEKSNA